MCCPTILSFFFFNDTATTEIYPLSLHDALPIWLTPDERVVVGRLRTAMVETIGCARVLIQRSEEHTSELQSRSDLVCRLLLEKKKTYHPRARAHTPSHAVTWITPMSIDCHACAS